LRLSSEIPTRDATRRPRRTTLIVLAVVIFLLFGIIFSQAAFNLTFLRPSTTEQTLVFAALSAIIFLLLVALTFVLVRTLLKLYLERQSGTIGSKFRTKLVLGALVLSFGPVIVMFLFSYGLMNRSIDKWFSRPAEEVREHTSTVTTLLTAYAGRNAQAEADSIAASAEAQKAFQSGNFGPMLDAFRRHRETLQGGFAFAILDDEPGATFQAPETWHLIKPKLPLSTLGKKSPGVFSLNGVEYLLATAPVNGGGKILVAIPLPQQYSQVLRELEDSERKYVALRSERKLIRQTYMQLLLLLTVLVLFAATWFALYLSKLVTRPVSALADATEAISSGHLDYRVDVPAGDELAELIASFNRMAAELESNRSQIEEGNRQLDDRRRHMETILESIPTGVISLDANGKATHVNSAFRRMFRLERAGPGNMEEFRERLPEEVSTDLRRMLRKADRMGTTSAQIEVPMGAASMKVGVTVASMDPRTTGKASRLGYVMVFEDLSELLQAQRQAAWREVARRIAHEIKNPLTPIQLSAERIRRHLDRGAPDAQSLAVIHGCAETIAGAVETVRALVDEFSTLARFPQSKPQPSDINDIIESALALFDGRLNDLSVRKILSPDLPRVMADPEAIKRVVANLVDNAAEAMKDSMLRELTVTSSLLGGREAVEVTVADTGQGLTPDIKERLFLPYFSTKGRGTGLGLSIVARIIEDHRGSIRAEENKPVGARFIVELPIAAETEREHTSDAESLREAGD
jgi:two-component system nitrogen regulation sensor histidine kinase NtrY